MNDTQQEQIKSYDSFKWLVVSAFFIVGIVANYYFSHELLVFRLLGWLMLLAVSFAVVWRTAKGQQIIAFAKESRVELRKVVWPTRQETIQTTIAVMVMVVITALVLWMIDSLLLWVISFITGQKG